MTIAIIDLDHIPKLVLVVALMLALGCVRVPSAPTSAEITRTDPRLEGVWKSEGAGEILVIAERASATIDLIQLAHDPQSGFSSSEATVSLVKLAQSTEGGATEGGATGGEVGFLALESENRKGAPLLDLLIIRYTFDRGRLLLQGLRPRVLAAAIKNNEIAGLVSAPICPQQRTDPSGSTLSRSVSQAGCRELVTVTASNAELLDYLTSPQTLSSFESVGSFVRLSDTCANQRSKPPK